MKNSMQVAALVALMVFTERANSAPPPLPAEKMWEYSDAIVVVDVLSLTHTGKKGLQDETVYSVRMRVRSVKKGRVRVGRMIVWEMSNYQPAPGEIGGGVFYPGERALLYLEQYPGGSFNTWGHDCVEMTVQVPENQQRLPQKTGGTIYAKGSRPITKHRCRTSR